jgi:hypothetical protein
MTQRAKRRTYKVWTKDDLKELKQHSRAKTPVRTISKAMKRSEGTIRQKAYQLEFSVPSPLISRAAELPRPGGRAASPQ